MATTITVAQGEDKVINLTFKKNDAVFDITGYSIYFYCKDYHDNAALVFDESGVITDAANGEASVTLSSANTDTTPDRYIYEVRLEDGSGNKFHTGIGDLHIVDTLKVPS